MWKIELIGGHLESNFEKILFGVNDVFDGVCFKTTLAFIWRERCETWKHDSFARYIEDEFSWLVKKTKMGLHCHVELNKSCGKPRNGKFYAEWSLALPRTIYLARMVKTIDCLDNKTPVYFRKTYKTDTIDPENV